MIADLPLLHLLQLASPGLPIGVYSYSQGLETAIEDRLVTDVEEAGEWISGILIRNLGQVDVPIASRLYDAWKQNDRNAAIRWSATLMAYRESSELRQEDRQTGQALARLLKDMDLAEAGAWVRKPDTTLASMYTLAAARWSIPKRAALLGLLWSWLENQVLCAVKLVPLGQVAGQRLVQQLAKRLPDLIDRGLQLDDGNLGGSAFGLAMVSSRHEIQYSRLFRS